MLNAHTTTNHLRRLASVTMLVIVLGASHALATGAILDVVNHVSQTNYEHYLRDQLFTHTGDNRGYGAQHDPARTNIFDLFDNFGLRPVLDGFPYSGHTYYNVVATLPGTTARSNQLYIIGAHYDSVNNPGADDNASGVAGVLEAARVLSQYRFEATLVFVAFDREEDYLIGSTDFATKHAADDIRGMISIDMIAWNGTSNHPEIYGRSASDPIKLALSNSVALYGDGLTASVYGRFDASDHVPFESRGFQACFLYEGGDNPYYHTSVDTVDTAGYIDYAFASKMTRATVGWLATQAGLVGPRQPPPLQFARGSGNLAVAWPTNATGFKLMFATNLVAQIDWSPVPETVQTNGTNFTVQLSTGAAPRRFYRLQWW